MSHVLSHPHADSFGNIRMFFSVDTSLEEWFDTALRSITDHG